VGVPRARGERCTSWNERSTWPVLTRAYRAVCLLLRHFIHVTDNFCHLFCPFSQVVPWSVELACGAGLSLSSLLSPVSSLFCSVLSLLSSLFPLLVSPLDPLVYPPCYVLLFARSPFPMSLSSLRSSSLPVVRLLSSLPAPRSSRNCICCSSCLSARQISLRKST
jgi:hypothetical protein